MKYKAFLSYSHSDEKFGKWLHNELEKYKIPKALKKDHPDLVNSLYPIFRDRYELSAGDNLGVEIPKALENSGALIVVCSVNSANSKWVNEEILYYKKKFGENRIFPIIISGEPFAKESNRFNSEQECFPEALKYKIDSNDILSTKKTLILASSILEKEDGKKLAKMKLISGLLDINFGEFYRRDEERNIRNKVRNITLFSILLSFMIGLTIFSVNKKNKAEKLTFDIEMERGALYRDYINDPLKSKLIYVNAVKLNTNETDHNSSIIAYGSVNNFSVLSDIYSKSVIFNNLIINDKSKIDNISTSDDGETILTWNNGKGFFDDYYGLTVWKINKNKDSATLHHDSLIKGAIISDKENIIVSWESSNSINLWRGNDLKLISTISFPYDVKGVKFIDNKTQLLVWGDNIIRVWDWTNGRNISTRLTDKKIEGLEFNKESNDIAFWDFSNVINIFNLNNKEESKLVIKEADPINGVKFSKNGQQFLTWGSNLEVKLWDKQSKKILHTLKYGISSPAFGVIFSGDNKYILSWGDGKAVLWDTNTGNIILTLKHDGFVNGAIFTQNNKYILSWGRRDNIATLWSINSGRAIFKFKHQSEIIKSWFTKDKNYIVSCSMDGIIKVWKNTNINDFSSFSHSNWIKKVILFKSDNIIVIGQDNNIKIYDYSNNKVLFSLSHNLQVNSAILSKNEKFLLSWSFDGVMKLWNPNTGKIIHNFKNANTHGAIFNKDNSMILNWSFDDYKLNMYDTNSGSVILSLDHKPSVYSAVYGAIFSQNEKQVLSWGGSDLGSLDNKGKVVLWDIEKNSIIHELAHKYHVEGAVFSEKEKLILSWGGNPFKKLGEVKLWDVTNNKLLAHLKHKSLVNGAMLIKNNRYILSWSFDHTIKLWNVKTGKLKLTMKHSGPVLGVVINKKEDMILSWGSENKIRAWDLTANTPLYSLNNARQVNGLLFDEGEDFFITWGGGFNEKYGSVKLWESKSGKLLSVSHYKAKVNGALLNKGKNKIISWNNGDVNIFGIKNKNKNKNNLYYLQSQIETGAYLSKSGDVIVLDKRNWKDKKLEYESHIKSNTEKVSLSKLNKKTK